MVKKETSMPIVDRILFSIVSFGWICEVEFLDAIWLERFAAERTCA
jgi:hypothetical protein